MSEPRITDKDLFAATSNGDGTYNGFKLIQWLLEATTGKPVSDADAAAIMAEGIERARVRKEAAGKR